MRHYKHHFKSIKFFVVLLALACVQTLAAATQNPPAVTALLNRIGGDGTADRFVTIVDESISSNGKEAFVITRQDGKPCIKGSNISAVTTGINWYLNHYAHVNLSWNNLTTDLSSKTLPVPTTDETHESSVDYRYYLNYCTFSYSMSVWTWDRWQKEIDWMALHGINMPLQIVGLDVVWRNLLVNDLGYTKDEANAFIAGPCFQAWWGMNNLEGWGGPNPDWWYTRQEELAKKILARERELGMQPVLPGYAGMVPSNIESKKGYKANNQGNWCNFVRPYILDPNSTAFTEISALYYKRLEELMGTSEYYSMDPFHEGANTDGIDVASAYSKIADAMYKANSNGKWVIQFWQWSGAQYNVLDKVEKGKLIVLDLFSDAHTHFNDYKGHDAVYCALPNFGGRTGLFGRLSKIMTDFFTQKSTYSNIKGIGATPEAIEQVPVLYDALFELPWRSSAPDPKAWLAAYSTSRYGTANANAEEAWEKMRNSALNCQTALQGPHEAVLCARPNLSVDKVSSWGGTEIFYDAQDVLDAAYKMLQAKDELSGENYSYDLTDFARQALTDYGYYLLKGINEAATSNNATAYATRRDAYLQLILDLDALLNTNSNFMLGRWTNMARNIADEAKGTTESDKQWLELNNARTLITTWGENSNSEGAGLRDYSYREWGGMLKDFYYKRWKAFFDNRDNGTTLPNWFDNDRAWAHDASLSYSNQPTGNTADVATELFGKYFITVSPANASSRCFYRYISTDLGTALNVSATRGATYTFPTTLPTGVTATLSIDFNNDGTFGENETANGLTINVPTTAIATQVAARLTLSDGTAADFSILLKDNITTARTVSVNCDNKQGSVAIEGSDALSVTNTEAVSLRATAAGGYNFKNWTDANGNVVSTVNPYIYGGADAATFTANFVTNKWAMPKENLSEIGTIRDYSQYLKSLTFKQNNSDELNVYSTDECPSSLFHTTKMAEAAKGSEITLHWLGAGGMGYTNLSAYIDLNSDGDFNDEGELIKVEGEKEKQNPQLNDYTLKVLLPYDMPEGVTHIRLRLDGAWQKGYDAQTGAMPADNELMRMAYDVPVDILPYSAQECSVTVKADGSGHGTADANGQPDTYTYKAGESVVLRAYPADGYRVYWTDQYGRRIPQSWIEGNTIRFKASENGTYTANFEVSNLTFGSWKFDYQYDDNGITLTKVLSGEGELTIPASYEGRPIVGIAPTALHGQTALTSLSLSENIKQLGGSGLVLKDITGTKIENAPIALPDTLNNNKDWQVSFKVQNNGNTFNEWGSSLLATGSNALDKYYHNGFQFYLKKDGSLIIKTNGDKETTLTATQNVSSFDLKISHTKDGTLTFTVDNGTTTETHTEQSYQLNDITQFSTALPQGINIENLCVSIPSMAVNPFKGCTNLASVNIDNATYKSIDNVLYTADGKTLLARPEGLVQALCLPAEVKVINTHAFTNTQNLRCIIANTSEPALMLNEAFDNNTIYVQTAPANAAAYREAWSLPVVFDVEATGSLSETDAALLTADDAVNLNATATQSGTAPTLATTQKVWLTTTLSANEKRPFCFPCTPSKLWVEGVGTADLSALKLFTFNGKSFEDVSTIAAGSYLVQVPEAWDNRTLTFEFDKTLDKATTGSAPSFYGNATTKTISVKAPYYTYDESENEFVAHNTGSNELTLYPFMAAIKASSVTSDNIDGPSPVVYHKVNALTTDREYLIVATDDDGNHYSFNANKLSTKYQTKIDATPISVNEGQTTRYNETEGLYYELSSGKAKLETLLDGKYLNVNRDGFVAGSSSYFTITSDATNETFKLKSKDSYYIYFNKNTKQFKCTKSTNLASYETADFKLLEREPIAYINVVAPEGYTTFYCKDRYFWPEGIEQFASITGVKNGKIAIEWKSKAVYNKMEAKQALLIKAPQGKYPCYKAWFYSAHTISDNCLFGTEKDKKIEADDNSYFYQLTYGTIDGKRTFGFFWAEADGAPFINKGGKAYLKLPKNVANNAQGFALLPTITGIGAVSTDNHAPLAIFTLDGRKLQDKSVEELPAGAYIVNGNKVIVK